MASDDHEREPPERPDQIEELNVGKTLRGDERPHAGRDHQNDLRFSMLAMSIFFVGGALLSMAKESLLSDLGKWVMVVSAVGFLIQFLRAGAPRR